MKAEDKQALIEWCNWRIAKGRKTLLADASYDAALITLAALTAQPVELVPDGFSAIRLQKAKLWIDGVLMDKPGMKEAQTVSAILRNIEEAK